MNGQTKIFRDERLQAFLSSNNNRAHLKYRREKLQTQRNGFAARRRSTQFFCLYVSSHVWVTEAESHSSHVEHLL